MHLKKVLIIDESERSKDRLNVLINNITDYQVDIPKNPDDAKKLFDSNFYCFVIIEHNCKIANDFMSFVLEHNPKQKMILLSDSLNCPIDCDTCTSNFNFVRLLKPITIENITQFLVNGSDDDFICPNKYRFDNIDSLEKLYEFIYLDENYFYTEKELVDDVLYIKTKLNGTLKFNELTKIEDYVNKKYFDFSVTQENHIVIKKL